ncbi:MAG: class I SAM-dependent methyltransferase [Myxococcota bacterium]
MKSIEGVGLADVKAIYEGVEGDLFELVFGEQIHIGGLGASIDLAERAGIQPGRRGVDLCCCNGAGMRFLVQCRGVAQMTGVDATRGIVERGRRRCSELGLEKQIRFVLADGCESGLPDGEADFVWGEDAWCYVADKGKLVAEAARLLRPGGTLALTDWIEGPAGLDDAEAELFLRFMRFPTLFSLEDYRRAIQSQGLRLVEAEDTGRFARYAQLYLDMIELQLGYDALRLLDFDEERLRAVTEGYRGLRDLASAGKIAQGRFIARR